MPLSFLASPAGGAIIGGGLGLLGGILQGGSSQSAAETSAQAQRDAANQAAQAALFRPVGVTTRYGSSQFQTNPQGYLTGASYMGTPELQAMQDRIDAINRSNLGYAEQAGNLYSPLLGGAQSLYSQAGLGLKATPEQQAADYLQKQQALLAPGRERESALLANQLSNSGRTGLSIAQGGGLLSANPEQSALANARAMQDLQLAANATQEGRNATAFYSGLFGTGGNLTTQYGQGLTGGFAPFNAGISTGSTLEGLAQNPLSLGASLGGNSATSGANVGNYLYRGGVGSAGTLQEANAYNPYATGLINASTNKLLGQGISNLVGNATLMNNVVPQSTFTGGITPSEFSNYQSMGIF